MHRRRVKTCDKSHVTMRSQLLAITVSHARTRLNDAEGFVLIGCCCIAFALTRASYDADGGCSVTIVSL